MTRARWSARGAHAAACTLLLALAATAHAQPETTSEPPESEPADAPDAPDTTAAPASELGEAAEGDAAETAETESEADAGDVEEGEAAEEEAEEPDEGTPVDRGRGPVRYVVERIEIRGNTRTDPGVIRAFVPVRPGEVLDIEDARLEATRWRLFGTGWFDEVRLRLDRGSARGRVVLVVDVRERNTFVVQGVALGVSEGVLNSLAPNTQVEPYFGISLAETNLFGTGVGASLTALLSVPQQGVRLRAGTSSIAGTDWGLGGTLFFNNGREFFGNDDVVIAVDECPPGGSMRCEEGLNAVMLYRRYGGSIGTGVDLATSLRFTLDYQL